MSFTPSHDPRFRSSQCGNAAASVATLGLTRLCFFSCLLGGVPSGGCQLDWHESCSTSQEHPLECTGSQDVDG